MAGPSKTKIFITGITGFTGKHIEHYLINKGFSVYGTTLSEPNNTNHFHCDILDEESLFNLINKIRPDYIIHLAAVSFTAAEDQNKIYDINIFGTLNLLNAIKSLNYTPLKILIASTASVYGNIEGELDESVCPKPVNHYGNSKLAMENMTKAYFDKMNIIIVRPFNYTGVGQEDHFLIPKIVSHYKSKRKVIELGNINVYREFNGIEFVIETYYNLLVSDIKSETFNVCTGRVYNIKSILSILNVLAGYEIKIKINPKFIRENEIQILKGSPEKLFEHIGKPTQNFELEMTLKKMFLDNT